MFAMVPRYANVIVCNDICISVFYILGNSEFSIEKFPCDRFASYLIASFIRLATISIDNHSVGILYLLLQGKKILCCNRMAII